MKRTKLLLLLLTLLVASALVLAACGGGATEEPAAEEPAAEEPAAEEPAEEEEMAEEMADLSIIWFAWQPCEALGELAARYDEANVTVNCVPIAEWYNTTFTDFAAQGGADLTVMDSQWIGEAVVGGHVNSGGMERGDWRERLRWRGDRPA